jgi:hypothetical protein
LCKHRYSWLRSDPCIYIYCIDDDFVTITMWVDDMLLFATTIELKKKAINDVQGEWEMSDLGMLTKIVGIELTITPDSIFISSSSNINSILEKEQLSRCNAVSTLLDPNVPLEANPKGNIGNWSNSYARLLGELQYIANAMHPDIAYAVNRLAAYTANLSLQHSMALKRVLRYLSGTRTHGITYKVVGDKTDLFSGYTDTAYANADEGRSTTGYVFMAGEGTISWNSKKQISNALSSTQVEYVVLSEAAREVCWLRNLYTELGLLREDIPTKIWGDNNSSIAMVHNPQFHKQTKHIAIRWHWLHELV